MKSLTGTIVTLAFTLLLSGCERCLNYSCNEKNKTADNIYKRIDEPNEKAFSFLAPEGWEVSGGIVRVNSINLRDKHKEAKLYMKLSSPDSKSVFCWLPDNSYHDTHYYQNEGIINEPELISMPYLSPKNYIIQIAFPFAHPHAKETKLIEVDTICVNVFQNNKLNDPQYKACSSAIVTLCYKENDNLFIEKFFCTIEDNRQSNFGEWRNLETCYCRTIQDNFKTMSDTFTVIRKSVYYNPQWVQKEKQEKIIQNKNKQGANQLLQLHIPKNQS